MEQKYISVAMDGELYFDSVAHGNLNERNIDEANAELAKMAVGCHREAEHNIDRDIRLDKIILSFSIGFACIFVIVSIVMTITLDWGFYALTVLSGVMLLLCFFIFVDTNQRTKEQCTHTRLR